MRIILVNLRWPSIIKDYLILSMEKLAVFSFFSGSGFLDLGFEHSDFDIKFVNENHLPFLDAYKYTRNQLKIIPPEYGYSSNSIEYFMQGAGKLYLKKLIEDVRTKYYLFGFIGGPPCPDFSVGGKNKGKDGKNGKLTKIYIDLVINNKPDFFVFENVKGLWRTKRHREFYEEIKQGLMNEDYLITERLTNCIEFGAPQDRDRIIMFGIRKKYIPYSSQLTFKNMAFNWEKYIKYDKEKVLDKSIWPSVEDYQEGSYKPMPKHLLNLSKLTIQHWFEKNDVENHPNASHHFVPRAGLAKMKIIGEGDDRKKSYKRLHRWRYSPTAAYGNNEVHLHPYKNRRLSAAEALAIQSMPKEFYLPENMSLSNMFKTIGNGIPYLASLGIANTVSDFLNRLLYDL